jgi:hypothetical protein
MQLGPKIRSLIPKEPNCMNLKLKNLIKRLLTPFNIKIPISINKRRFKVLVLDGVKVSNLDISEPWMIDTLRR